ncbi:hypothetical protein BpHYR1_005082 [Brachionus plicatilis]|uniref:Uncharacterized protein n=1 Tax=Brachionus plicatilis TaxID=10195 RepID=A0A3M7SUJ6_BRAPC|nr:hypothetical protein BpHYR1_005082 [Brachionus plicatilis]
MNKFWSSQAPSGKKKINKKFPLLLRSEGDRSFQARWWSCSRGVSIFSFNIERIASYISPLFHQCRKFIVQNYTQEFNCIGTREIMGAILQNLHRFCRLPQKVKQQLFHFVSFTEQVFDILKKTRAPSEQIKKRIEIKFACSKTTALSEFQQTDFKKLICILENGRYNLSTIKK